jgi:Gas vesicle protein K
MLHVDENPATPFRLAMEVGDPFAPPRGSRARLELEPGKIERGLLKLVLSLVELIRQLMEKQAMRRIEAGSLTEEEVDRLGRSLLEVETKIRELQVQFGIDDLNIDLGPMGSLVDQ